MKLYTEDDNELLYLITCGSQMALSIMYAKFENMIRNRVARYNVPAQLWDDYAQEGRLILNKAIKHYCPESLKTFNRFFDLIWCRHIITMLRRQKTRNDNMVLVDNDTFTGEQVVTGTSFIIDEIDLSQLSNTEKRIYQLRYIEDNSIEQICLLLNKKEKQVYNAIQRLKHKLKKSVIRETA